MPPTVVIVKTIPVAPVQERLVCAGCNEEMKRGPEVLTSSPPQYVYRCPKCNGRHDSIVPYPRIVFKPAEGA